MVRAFKKAGFSVISEGKHIGMSDGTYHLTIPRHVRLNPYTLKGIIKSANLTDADFKKLL
ncbi:MAG: type II toxin-antitoxin system HicA family toxin [Elusimicrobiota bacterium]